MSTIIRATEQQLLDEIEGIGALMRDTGPENDRRARWARSYLRLLMKDRQETLRLLRYRKAHGLNPTDASDTAPTTGACIAH